jgi:hypothetical protein
MARTNTRLNGALRGAVAVGASAGGVEAQRSVPGTESPSSNIPTMRRLRACRSMRFRRASSTIRSRPSMSVRCSRSWPTERFRSGTWSPTKAWKLKTGSRWAADFQRLFDAEALDPHSGYTRPDCNGSLMSVSDNNYRCRVDHAWTADALLKARPGMLHRRWRYTDLADEAERAVTVIGRRLSEATSGAGERGDG